MTLPKPRRLPTRHLFNCLLSAVSTGQQERYTPSASDGSDSESDPAASPSHSRQQQQQYQEQQQQHNQQHGLASNQQQSPPHAGQQQQWQGRQQQMHQQPAARSASALAQYACSAADSEEDVCQWHSPIRPTRQLQQYQGRPVLQDIRNSGQQHGTAAGLTGLTAAAVWRLQQQHEQEGQQPAVPCKQHGSRLSVDADALQILLDKVRHDRTAAAAGASICLFRTGCSALTKTNTSALTAGAVH